MKPEIVQSRSEHKVINAGSVCTEHKEKWPRIKPPGP